ncbi:MAG TPA: AbrB family transcriptional regulator [Candidatus Omnitrophota bacterium]|nr:AbrB family transcriptional regulator [Candidatus Omnitrophota bacterium]
MKALALALLLGSAGGAAFFVLNLPLPWMLGSMTACTVAALSGMRPAVPRPLRFTMIAVLGIMLGSAFTPEIVDRVGGWTGTLAGLFAAMAATSLLVTPYLRRFGAMDKVTAYFAAAPGGINEMVLAGGAMGGDERDIALIHALRILLIVFAVPFGFRLVTGVQGQPMTTALGSLADLAWSDAAILTACAIGGAFAARVMRWPAWMLTGPMVASAVPHLMGLTASHPPAELVIVAQVVTGAGIGSRFAGLGWKDIGATARVSLGSTAIMLATSAGAAGALAAATGLPFALLLLAFVPGGIAEMCLIALALGQDVAFVSTHHVLRVAMVIVAAPLAFRWMGRG